MVFGPMEFDSKNNLSFFLSIANRRQAELPTRDEAVALWDWFGEHTSQLDAEVCLTHADILGHNILYDKDSGTGHMHC